jgi:GT2 family glycosyltransferase
MRWRFRPVRRAKAASDGGLFGVREPVSQDAIPLHPLRRLIRRMPGLRRFLLRRLRPLMPQVSALVRRLEGPSFARWVAQWQDSGPADDAAIAALLAKAGAASQPVLVMIAPGRRLADTRESLRTQTAVTAEVLATPDDLARMAAPGRWLIHLNAGDRLARHALAEIALAACQTPRPLVIFADEATPGGPWGGARPWFKTAFDPDRLLQQAALGRAAAYDSGLLARHGLLGLRGHALMLAATQAATLEAGPEAIVHRPSVLLTRGGGSARPWRDETDTAAIGLALAARGDGVELVEDPARRSPCPRLRWPLPAQPPRVSVIVPTRDATALMEACMAGLLHRTDYPAMEILICDNDSRDPALLARFQDWSRDSRVRVLACPGPFNYAAINNRAAREASGEILLLLNNDTEVRHPDWLREMASLAIRPGIGAVGARLLFPHGQVQHAGVVLGLDGIAGHDMLQASGRSSGPYDLLRLTRRVSAVTAACLAIRRETFLTAGGFDETHLRVAYNDVDLCLRLRAMGLENLVTPHAELTHKESATRGDDMSDAHRARWESERAVMRARWGAALEQDPYYSPNLDLRPPSGFLAVPPRRLAAWRRG